MSLAPILIDWFQFRQNETRGTSCRSFQLTFSILCLTIPAKSFYFIFTIFFISCYLLLLPLILLLCSLKYLVHHYVNGVFSHNFHRFKTFSVLLFCNRFLQQLKLTTLPGGVIMSRCYLFLQPLHFMRFTFILCVFKSLSPAQMVGIRFLTRLQLMFLCDVEVVRGRGELLILKC